MLNLTGLPHDPDLQSYMQAQVRQVKSDFQDDSVFPGATYQECSCPSAGTSHWRLARKIRANKAGWQDELAQSLPPYVLSHLSASIVGNCHEALAAGQPLDWRSFAPCDVRQNRNSPSSVLEAAAGAMRARIMLRGDALQQCVVTGRFLNAIKSHWLGCGWFREGHQGSFPEHRYLRHELLREALGTYAEQPSRETFELSLNTLRLSLAALPCPIGSEHPELHLTRCEPALEHLGDGKASGPSIGPEKPVTRGARALC